MRRWRHLPAAGRTLAAAAEDAVAAASAHDVAGYEDATGELAGLNPEQVGSVLGAVVRMLLEQLHPDGLAGEDVQAVWRRSARSAVTWFPAVDPYVLAALLTGALGVHPVEGDAPPPSAPDVARHAPLLIADLVGVSGLPFPEVLDAAFADLARSETMELP